MRTAPRKTSVHMDAREKLIAMMGELYAQGVMQLPSLRDLAKELEVSLMTANRIVTRLAMEGRIQQVPRLGNFICGAPSKMHIGILMGCESDCSFIYEPLLMSSLLNSLSAGDCDIRMLQITKAERALELISEFKLDACIWYLPFASAFPKVGAIAKEAGIPIAPLIATWASVPESALPPGHVAFDLEATGRNWTDHLLRRGHRQIARFNCTSNYAEIEYARFVSTLAEAGIEHDSALNVPPWEVMARIPEILESGKATAAIVNGGEAKMRNVLKAISGHRNARRIELLLDNVGSAMPGLLAKFPDLNVVGINCFPAVELGAAAAKSILSCLNERRLPASMKIAPRIATQNEFKANPMEVKYAS